MNYPAHQCPRGIEPVQCGNCLRGWCEACDPGPAALCPFCHGRGYSTAPIPPRQMREVFR